MKLVLRYMPLHKVFLIILFTVLPQIALAEGGGSDGGGGVGFDCGSRVHLADTFLSGNGAILGGDYSIPKQTLSVQYAESILRLLRSRGKISAQEFTLLTITMRLLLKFDSSCEAWITNDDGLTTETPFYCRKVQIASQRHGRVCYNRELVSRMGPADIGMLVIHEAYVYFSKRPNESTARIRQMVGELAESLQWNALVGLAVPGN